MHTGTDTIVEHSLGHIVTAALIIYEYVVLCVKMLKQGLRVCTCICVIQIIILGPIIFYLHRNTCLKKWARNHFAFITDMLMLKVSRKSKALIHVASDEHGIPNGSIVKRKLQFVPMIDCVQ